MSENEVAGSTAVSRRKMLKVGAAAGVGVAAWTGPQIGIFGATPAYAAHCTPKQFTETEFSSKKTQVSWPSSCDPSGNYGGSSLTFGNGLTFTTAGGCANVAKYTIGNVPAGQTCVPVVRVFNQSSGESASFTGMPTEGPSGGNMPNVLKTTFGDTNGSWFYEVKIRCADTLCFH